MSYRMVKRPKIAKDLHAEMFGYARPSGIERKRKRQIVKARHELAWHDHTSYEWSQWWYKPARKPRRWSR